MKKIALFVALVLILGLLVLPGSLSARKASQKIGILSETNTNTVFTNLGLFGGYVWDLAVDPTSNSYIYAAVGYSPNGIYSSSNGGLTWFGLPSGVDYGSGQDVEVNPSNGHVFAVLGNTLLKSTDHGTNFTEIKNANASSILYSGSRLFVGTGDGQMKASTDEGASFATSTITSGSSIQSIAAYGDAVYALNYSNRLFKSTDAGSTWTEITGLPLTSITRVAVNPNTGHVFILPPTWGGTTYRSDDGGTSWSALAADTPTSGYITFDNATPSRTYIGWKYSTNEGTSWADVNDRGSYNHLLIPDPTNANILYDTSSPGFSKSLDKGATWASSVEGILGVVVTSVSQTQDKNIVWTATQNGLAKTTNFLSASPTWTYPIRPNGDTYISGSHDSVWVNPSNLDIVVMGGSNVLNRSTNGGTTWSEPTTDLSFTENLAYQIIANADNSVIYTAVGKNVGTTTNPGGVMQSTNNGANWTTMGFPANSAQSIAVAIDGDLFVGAGSKAKDETDKGIYKYSGDSWSRLSVPNYDFRAIVADPEAASTIYALAGSQSSSNNANSSLGFYKSTDDGASWRQIVVDPTKSLYEYNTLTVQRSTTPNSLYLSAVDDMSGVVYKSSDGGESWGLFYKGLKSETFSALLFDGLVAGNDRGLYNVKSRASLGIRKIAPKVIRRGSQVKFKISLRDSTVFKKRVTVRKNKKKVRKTVNRFKWLKRRIVSIYKLTTRKVKVNGKWRKRNRWIRVKRLRISKKGYALFSMRLNSSAILQARWSPGSASDKEEYASARSKNLKVKVRK